MKWRRAIHESRRVLRDYGRGIAAGAGHWYLMPKSALNVLHARLGFGIGPRHYALFGLQEVPVSRWSDYLTDLPDFKDRLRNQSPAAMHELANDKAVFYRHCRASGLASPPIICTANVAPGRYADVPAVRSAEELERCLHAAGDTFFVKQIDGTFGEGAFPVDRVAGMLAFAGRTGHPGDLLDYLQSGEHGKLQWLVQPRLCSHPELSRIMSPHGLGTVRVVTCISGGQAIVLFALLKLIVGVNHTDNFHHGSTGNLVARVDIETGSLDAARGSDRRDWPRIRAFAAHPDTGQAIAGTRVPCWSEVMELALRAQRSVPDLKSAGWDIGVTPDGPLLLEANLTYSTDIMQVAYGRGLKRELLAALAT